MTVYLSPLAGAGWQFLDNNGNPLSGGKLYVYEAGTTNPVTTYTTSAGATPNTNPIILDSAGRVNQELWLTEGSSYKFVLMSSKDVLIWTKDNITGINDVAGVFGAPTGSSLIGFIGTGNGATATNVQTVLRQVIRVTDYADLVYVATARSPGDPNSHLSLSFNCWDLAIQAALDEAYNRGGGIVVLPKNTVPYYVRDPIYIKSNTIFECEDWIILADYNYIGGTVFAVGENIEVRNIKVDNSNIYAGGSGYNGLNIAPMSFGLTNTNVKFYGGIVKNCASGFGNTGAGDGGKGIQIESTNSANIVVDGVTFDTCFMAMSTQRNLAEVQPYKGILYNNITAKECFILFLARQTNAAQSQTGLEHAVVLSNFYARNCGRFEGVFQFSRASNIKIANGIVVNEATYPTCPLIRGNHANTTFDNIAWYGGSTPVIDTDVGTYIPDAAQAVKNNRYNLDIWGTPTWVAFGTNGAPNVSLNGCVGNVTLRNAPTSGFFSYAMRNGNSQFQLVSNTGPFGQSKAVMVDTATNFDTSGNPNNFAAFDAGITQCVKGIRFDSASISAYNDVLDFYEQGSWTPTVTFFSGSGAAYTATGYYVRVGAEITAKATVIFTGLGTSSGRLIVGGLPFAVRTGDGSYQGAAFAYYVTTANVGGLCAVVGSASPTGAVLNWTSISGAGDTTIVASQMASNTEIRFTITYRV